MTEPTLFVSIASYRDPETPITIEEIFSKAKYPDRITIGLLSQLDHEEDRNAVVPYSPKVRQMVVPWEDSLGACWARSKILTRLRKNEDYVFQIDSHTRFIQHWDEALFDNYLSCNDSKAVLSHYPTGYKPPDKLDKMAYTYHNVQSFSVEGLPNISSGGLDLSVAPPTPNMNALFAGGCAFGAREVFDKVPYDPYLYFVGEEISMAVRLFTHGFNIYTPNNPFMWHYYTDEKDGEVEKPRRRHWDDHITWGNVDRLAKLRIKHLLDIEKTTDKEALKDLDKYTLGPIRSLEDYQRFSGLNFKDKTVQQNAKDGIFKL